MKTYDHWIGGRSHPPVSGSWLDTVDPFSGRAWAKIPLGNSQDVNKAVAAAAKAMHTGPWASMSAAQRGRILWRIGEIIAAHAEMLVDVEVRDNGKLVAEMRKQIRYISEYWQYFAGVADKIQGSVVPVDDPQIVALTRHEPVGVVAALTAWNAPLMFFAIKCAPALAAGCAVVLKPSEFASASSLELAALTAQAGLPDGVINVVAGLGAEVGAALVDHPDVAAISFTGSDATGGRIYQAAARGIKRVHLELGGKSPNIVFEDADMDRAVNGVVSGIMGAAGQMCTAGSRLLIQNSIKEKFTERLLTAVRAIKLGDPMDNATQMGPIATEPQFRKVLEYIDIARAEGATCLLGGEADRSSGESGGKFVAPTIFTDVSNDMRIAQEEVFGPVLAIIGFEDEAEAVAIANDVDFGLAAGVWTKDIGRGLRMSEAIKAGTVWVNTYRAYSYSMPFGGMKRSGVGRESGIEAVHEFLETKSVMISKAP